MGNPNNSSYDQATKLLELVKPLSDDMGKLQHLFESGLLSDLVKSFESGKKDEIIRNDYRKSLGLPYFQDTEAAIKILGTSRMLMSSEEKFSGKTIPYFKETLLWAKEQNDKGRDIFLLYIPHKTFLEIKNDLIEKDDSNFSFLDNPAACNHFSLVEIFSDCRIWDGYYLVDFGIKEIVLYGYEEERKKRKCLSVPGACLFLYFLERRKKKDRGRYWIFSNAHDDPRIPLKTIYIVYNNSRLKLNLFQELEKDEIPHFVGDTFKGDNIYLIKRDEY